MIVRENSEVGRPHKDKSTNAYARGGTSRSSDEVMETSWSEGGVLSITKTNVNFSQLRLHEKEEQWQQ